MRKNTQNKFVGLAVVVAAGIFVMVLLNHIQSAYEDMSHPGYVMPSAHTSAMGHVRYRFRRIYNGENMFRISQEHKAAPTLSMQPAYAQSGRYPTYSSSPASSVVQNASSAPQVQLKESAGASVKNYGGGANVSVLAEYSHSSATRQASSPVYASAMPAPSKSSVRNIVSVAHEAEEEAMAMSAPRRASILPPPPVEEPDEEKQLGYVGPIGDVSFAMIALFIGVYLAVRTCLRRRKTLAK